MLHLQDAERAVHLDFETDAIVADSEPEVRRSLQPLHITFTAVAISSEGVEDLDRMFAIDLA